MNLRQLEYFVRIAEHGSINQAARSLDVAQSALTRQLQTLEGVLGAPLLARGSRGVALTNQGRCLLGYAVEVLALLAEARQEIAGIADET